VGKSAVKPKIYKPKLEGQNTAHGDKLRIINFTETTSCVI